MNDNLITYFFIFLLWLIIVFFSSKAEQSYPNQLHQLTREPLYKLVILILIILVSEFSFTLSLLLSLVFLFMVADVNLLSEINEGFIFGPSVGSCSIYSPEDIKKTGTMFYPMNPNERTEPLQQWIDYKNKN